MWITKSLLNVIDKASSLSGNKVFLTDLENVRYIGNCTFSDNINVPICRKLLQKFLTFSYSDIGDDYFLLNGRENIIPIYEDKYFNTSWKSQIILPVYVDDSLYGTLISVNYYKTFNNKHLDFAKTTQSIVKQHILNILNEEWRKEHGNEG